MAQKFKLHSLSNMKDPKDLRIHSVIIQNAVIAFHHFTFLPFILFKENPLGLMS